MYFLITITLVDNSKIRKLVQADYLSDVEAVANRHIISGSYSVREFSEFGIVDLVSLEGILAKLSEREEV